jgi:hypothetical protein
LGQAQAKASACRKNINQLAKEIYTVDRDIKTKQNALRSNRQFKQDSNEAEEEEQYDHQRNHHYVQATVSC